MAKTLEFELTRRWRVRVTSRNDIGRDFVVDSDGELARRITSLAIDPTVVDFQCERYFGPQRPDNVAPGRIGTAAGDVPAVRIRCAAGEVFTLVERLRQVLGWPYVDFECRADLAVRRAQAALDGLTPDAPARIVAEAVRPVLAECWPASSTPLTGAVSGAVERLRALAVAVLPLARYQEAA